MRIREETTAKKVKVKVIEINNNWKSKKNNHHVYATENICVIDNIQLNSIWISNKKARPLSSLVLNKATL